MHKSHKTFATEPSIMTDTSRKKPSKGSISPQVSPQFSELNIGTVVNSYTVRHLTFVLIVHCNLRVTSAQGQVVQSRVKITQG